jgi:diguanylate cyclase (GGDEF)-like protein
MNHLSSEKYIRSALPFSILAIDIDYFKKINDRFGHHVGDEAIKLLAATLKAHIRVFDTLARVGGEEFVIVMPDINGSDARQIAERLRLAVKCLRFPEHRIAGAITISIGLVSFASLVSTSNPLKSADDHLYHAKRSGRDMIWN